jgi:hypothetical protein
VLGISRRQFDRLLARQVFSRPDATAPLGSRGRFDLSLVVPAYCRYMRDGSEASEDVAAAKLKLIDAQRHSIVQRTRERDGELLERDEVGRVFNAVMVQVRAALGGLPGRYAGEIAAISNEPARVREMLADECRRIGEQAAAELSALADRVGRGEALDTSAETDGGPVGGNE